MLKKSACILYWIRYFIEISSLLIIEQHYNINMHHIIRADTSFNFLHYLIKLFIKSLTLLNIFLVILWSNTKMQVLYYVNFLKNFSYKNGLHTFLLQRVVLCLNTQVGMILFVLDFVQYYATANILLDSIYYFLIIQYKMQTVDKSKTFNQKFYISIKY